MNDGSSTSGAGEEQPRQGPKTSPSTTLPVIDGIQTPVVSDPYPERAGQEQGKEGTPAPDDRPQYVPSTSSSENKEMVITSIRATNVSLGLRRLPAGFYIAVHHGGVEWRTESMRSSVNDDIVEWSGPIPIPSNPSAIIRLEVHASFEFQPMLGVGERLRELTFTVQQLLDCSVKDVPFALFPKDGDVVSPRSSIFITVNWRNCKSSDSSTSKVLEPHCPTTGSKGELEDATNQGHSALSRYRKHGRKRDLERSIAKFEQALGMCPQEHPCRAAAQSNLAMAKFIFWKVGNTDASLEGPLSLYRKALAARPVGHSDRSSTLIHLATVHFARFEKQRSGGDGARAELLLHEAMELGPAESHEKRAAAFMLQLHAGGRMGAPNADGQSPVEQGLVPRLTDEDPWMLSDQLLDRFEQFGDLADLQEAIGVLEGLQKSIPVSDDRYRIGLGKLGLALQNRFDHLGELCDLEIAISTLRDVVDLTPHGHPDKPTYLNNLGNSLTDRFEHLGKLSDLEEAISTLRDAVDQTPRHHSHMPGMLGNLGSTLLARFEHLGDLSDLEEAISRQRDAVNLALNSHSDKPSHLNNLGNSVLTRFEYLGKLSDLEDAISSHRDAVNLTPHGHPDKPTRVSSLGSTLFVRFMRFGEQNDLEDAISRHREAVDLTPHSHPHKPGHLNNLGNSFKARFERLGQLGDLENAILILRDAVNLTPHGHPNKAGRLHNLGNSIKVRFMRLGNLSDLEDAISMLKHAVDITPLGHPEQPTYLNSLGNSLFTRFERLGELDDLQGAILIHRDAVNLTPDGYPHKSRHLNNLGNSFLARFEHLGELRDLEDAISTFRNALNLVPHGHPDKPALLYNLGNSFFSRFEWVGELSDLEDAILGQRDAVDLTPPGHPDKPNYLNKLGASFLTRFERIGELSDLEDGISMLKDAVDIAPHNHPEKSAYLNNLSNSFNARFGRLGELSDIEDAIATLRDAVDITPRGHPHMPAHLSNLGNSFLTRFKRLGELSDLETAISALRGAVDLTPRGHPHKPCHLNNLGNSFLARFEHLGELSDAKRAISLYSHAASASIGPISVRFRASQNWIACARRICHHSLLDAYSVTISLLSRLAWVGLPLTQRYYDLIRSGADVVREAAAAALDSKLPETAVEWLEQGRSIIWGELFQLRSAHEELASAHPAHAHRLRELSAALEHASYTPEKSSSWSTDMEQTQNVAHNAIESLQGVTDRHRALAIERDKLLQEIRRFPGFEHFLLRKQFSHLRASAHSGPVVILNAAETRCDALIVLADVDHVIHVPLSNFTFNLSTYLQRNLKSFIRHAREGKTAPWDDITWESFLSPLWKCVVNPVLDALAFSVPGDLSRIFWCPTGPFVFLPIHAAGFYDAAYSEPGHKVYDFVVSSYVPTLAILLPSPNPTAVPSDDLRLVAVRQPPTDGLSQLPGVSTEMGHIREIIGNSRSARTTLLESSVGTVEEVLGLMKEADWVHFACHGIQDTADPTYSGLCLADGRRLKLRDIIALSRPHGGLAFLSACQTATGDKRLSDEALHIAAGMLFAGYGGVVGTMWSISDKLAPYVARDVYAHLFRNGTRPDYREAARALHEAIGGLRDSNASFVEWVPFVHVGL